MSDAKAGTGAEGEIGLLGALSIGIGGIVGGGIFATLGLAVADARGSAWLSFLVAGIVALLTAYSYSKLSVAFPSEGGTVAFLNRGFGGGFLSEPAEHPAGAELHRDHGALRERVRHLCGTAAARRRVAPASRGSPPAC